MSAVRVPCIQAFGWKTSSSGAVLYLKPLFLGFGPQTSRNLAQSSVRKPDLGVRKPVLK